MGTEQEIIIATIARRCKLEDYVEKHEYHFGTLVRWTSVDPFVRGNSHYKPMDVVVSTNGVLAVPVAVSEEAMSDTDNTNKQKKIVENNSKDAFAMQDREDDVASLSDDVMSDLDDLGVDL